MCGCKMREVDKTEAYDDPLKRTAGLFHFQDDPVLLQFVKKNP